MQHLDEKAQDDSSCIILLPRVTRKCLQHLSTASLVWKNHFYVTFEGSVEEHKGF